MADSKAMFKIKCGDIFGYMFPERFGPGGKSLCVKQDENSSEWISLIEFEKRAGKGAQHNWKRTVRSVNHDNKIMLHLINTNVLKCCIDKNCKCTPCILSREGPSTSLAKDDKRDNDSDSGISVEISNSEATPSPVIREPLTTKEQEAPLPNYTVMVQEAIFALSSGDQGCSLLGIFLYILNQYPMTETVEVMNLKIRSTLAMLKRVGIVNNIGEEDDYLEELESVANESKNKSNEQKTWSDENKPEVSKTKETEPKNKKPKEIKKNSNGKPTKNVLLTKKKSSGKENSSNNKEQSGIKVKRPLNQVPKNLSPHLAAICGKKKMGRNDAVRAVWVYIKKHNLQHPTKKTVIICDDKLKAVTKRKRVTCNEIFSFLRKHMTTAD